MRNLYYLDDAQQWRALPKWANFFIRLGRYAYEYAAYSYPNGRLVIAVAVPTRDYAALFTALGVVTHPTAVAPEHWDTAQHFEYLAALPTGTKLRYWENNRIKVAEFGGHFPNMPDERVKVVFQSRPNNPRRAGCFAEYYSRTNPRVLDFSVSFDDSLVLPMAGNAGIEANPSPLLSGFLEGLSAKRYILDGHVPCALIGNQSTLEQELTETLLSLSQVAKQPSGRLSDLLLVRGVCKARSPYKVDMISDRTPDGDNAEAPQILGRTPPVVVLDGARALLKCRERIEEARVAIAVLSRVERTFGEAATELNSRYTLRAGDIADFSLPVPDGIRVMPFLEAM